MYSSQFQAHPNKPCSQHNHTNAVYKPNFYSSTATKCLQYGMHHIPAQRKHHHILQSQCITNTNTVRQQLCGPLALFLSISDCDQSFRSAYLTSCNCNVRIYVTYFL